MLKSDLVSAELYESPMEPRFLFGFTLYLSLSGGEGDTIIGEVESLTCGGLKVRFERLAAPEHW